MTPHQDAGGQLGRPSSVRRRVYERLKDYTQQVADTLFETKALQRAIEEIYARPLRETAREKIGRELRAGSNNDIIAELVIHLHEEDRLCVAEEETHINEPKIICSLGIRNESP